jgi:hypothetical protein
MARVGVIMLDGAVVGDITLDETTPDDLGGGGAMYSGPMSDLPGWLGGGGRGGSGLGGRGGRPGGRGTGRGGGAGHSDPDKPSRTTRPGGAKHVADPKRHAATDDPTKRRGGVADPDKPSGRTRWHRRPAESKPGAVDDPDKPNIVNLEREDPDKPAEQDESLKTPDVEDVNKQQVDALEPTKPAGYGDEARGGGGPSPYAGLKGSQYLATERAKFKPELKDDNFRLELAAIASLEHESDPIGPLESLMNRANAFPVGRGTLRERMFWANQQGNTFYSPINHGLLGPRMQQLRSDPARFARMNAAIEAALGGSNVLEGATDQGGPNDPNANWPGGLKIRQGEHYNDWGSGGEGGHARARSYRENQQRQVRAGGDVTLPSVVGQPYDQGGVAPSGGGGSGGAYQPGIEPRYSGGMRGGLTPEQVYGGLKPEMRARVQAMYRDMPPHLREEFEINEAFRTYEYQQELYDRLHGRAAVAHPGHSRHEIGEAVDVSDRDRLGSERLDWIHANAGRYGLEGILPDRSGSTRHGSDTGHIQLNRGDTRTFGPPRQGSAPNPSSRIAEDLHSIAGIHERVYGGAAQPATPATPSTPSTPAANTAASTSVDDKERVRKAIEDYHKKNPAGTKESGEK